jgi:hypothetical protein
MKTKSNGLVGKFFHSLNSDKKVEWQGFVLSNPEPGWYLVQLFEWLMGNPNVIRLVRIEQMESWLFYPSAKIMSDSYDSGVAREGGPYRSKVE